MKSNQIDFNKKPENSPEENFKMIEKEINKLIDECAFLKVKGKSKLKKKKNL